MSALRRTPSTHRLHMNDASDTFPSHRPLFDASSCLHPHACSLSWVLPRSAINAIRTSLPCPKHPWITKKQTSQESKPNLPEALLRFAPHLESCPACVAGSKPLPPAVSCRSNRPAYSYLHLHPRLNPAVPAPALLSERRSADGVVRGMWVRCRAVDELSMRVTLYT